MAKVQYTFDPFDLIQVTRRGVSDEKKNEVLDRVSDFILESVLSDVGSKKSPVTGESFQALNKDYKTQKKSQGATPVPNLELTGSMLDSLKVIRTNNKLILTVDEDQMDKADNHNKFSAASKNTPVPARKFIPNSKDDETFRPGIISGIKTIIEDVLGEDL